MATTIQPLNYNIHIRRITSKHRAFKYYVTHLWVLWQPNRPHPVPRRHLAWTVRRCNGSWTPESPFFGYPRNLSRMDRWSSSPSSLVLRKISGILSGTLCCKIGPKCKLTVSQWTWRNRLYGTSPSLWAFLRWKDVGEGCWDFVIGTSFKLQDKSITETCYKYWTWNSTQNTCTKIDQVWPKSL